MVSRCKALLGIVLVCLAVYVSLYTVQAYRVAVRTHKDNDYLWWTTFPPGTFFPWPKGPGPFQAISHSRDPVDLFIYTHLITTGFLLAGTVLVWVCVGGVLVYLGKS
ncbi:MAG: hypothetical protein GWO20_04685, partial [Candidatus Korarchaeota archaeon]|nr:hypothetical protein [Candidatus Korarchaeota archaeon]NIU83255.1 hypothetical protein [Candidatus Thorarchaeota archaeon]NIW13189.1 hypothetical protein [Candidatus Thorarchaeota archaeon]NIW51328.1 hypothetical protein [Candidatus Korarchaeota archaeon]